MFSTSFASLTVLHFFFLNRSPSLLVSTVFDSISPNIDEILSINPSANIFLFGDFNVHHKDWLTYSGGTDKPGDLFHRIAFECYCADWDGLRDYLRDAPWEDIFRISNSTATIVNFVNGSGWN